MRATANAKVNLSLRVGSVRSDGFHPLRSLFQSVSLSDRLELSHADEDAITGWDGEEVPDGDRNLAWQAVTAVREAIAAEAPSRERSPLRLRLAKRIPVAAGLGGGSADAAAALHLAVKMLHADAALVGSLAAGLGSDVPFCATGGSAMVTGRGDVLHPLEPLTGFALGIVVPPIELATPAVYRAWDRLGDPKGLAVTGSGLPPALRPHAPLVNDLYPAAVSLAPTLDEWRHELTAAWDRPVVMSGSGPTLIGCFVDLAEARAALETTPPGARATHTAEPVDRGWAWEQGA